MNVGRWQVVRRKLIQGKGIGEQRDQGKLQLENKGFPKKVTFE